jgi:cytochrome c oxidase assembly protein subunit 15
MKKISANGEAQRNIWLHRFAFFTACITFPLIFVGGLVKSHEAGLSVPDWPTTYGYNMFTFPLDWMVGGIFYEHGHRLIASFVGFCILVLAFWLWRREPRRWVRRLGWITLAAVCIQGALGGLTVYLLLPTWNSSAHAALAQITFCLTVALAMVTSPKWDDNVVRISNPRTEKLRTSLIITLAVIFIQLLLGAVMRHEEAGLAIPTFPLAEGKLIPEFTSLGVTLNFLHRLWAVVVAVMVIRSARLSLNVKELPSLRGFAMTSIILVLVQISLGALTIWSGKEPNITSLHVVGGAAVLASVFILTMRTFHQSSSNRQW